MRLLLISLLMIPLAVGCGDSDEAKSSDVEVDADGADDDGADDDGADDDGADDDGADDDGADDDADGSDADGSDADGTGDDTGSTDDTGMGDDDGTDADGEPDAMSDCGTEVLADTTDAYSTCFAGDDVYGACETCGYSDDPADALGVNDCITCPEGMELDVFFGDCTGYCVPAGTAIEPIATSDCEPVTECVRGDIGPGDVVIDADFEWTFEGNWTATASGIDYELCDSELTVYGNEYTGECEDCTFAFELTDVVVSSGAPHGCGLPGALVRSTITHAESIEGPTLKHYDAWTSPEDTYPSGLFSNVLVLQYTYTESYMGDDDEPIESSSERTMIVTGLDEAYEAVSSFDYLGGGSLSVWDDSFNWGFSDEVDDEDTAMTCGLDTITTHEMPCDGTDDEHTDVWTFTVSEELVGTDISIEIDTVSYDSTFDPAATIYSPPEGDDSCLDWSGDDEFVCSYAPAEYECTHIGFTPAVAGDYTLAVDALGACAAETVEYAITANVDLAFTFESTSIEYEGLDCDEPEEEIESECSTESLTRSVWTTATF